EQVLAEAALFTLEHIGQALELMIAGASHSATTTTIIDQSITCLLQHALLVANDDLRGTEFKQALETVVAVDHAAIQVIEVRSCKSSAVELNHRAQVRR